MSKESRQDKALRLIREDRLRFALLLPDEAVLRVRGDTGDYDTWLHRGQWNCTCIAPKRNCSHIEAAKKLWRVVEPGVTILWEEVDNRLKGDGEDGD